MESFIRRISLLWVSSQGPCCIVLFFESTSAATLNIGGQKHTSRKRLVANVLRVDSFEVQRDGKFPESCVI